MTPTAIANAIRILRTTPNHRLTDSSEMQSILREWTGENIEFNFNRIVSELFDGADKQEELQDAGLLTAYGSYEDAATNEGWHLEEDSTGEYWGVETVEWSRIRFAEHAGKWYWYTHGEAPDLLELAELAVYDTDEAARDAALDSEGWGLRASDEDEAWQELCEDKGFDREEHEVFEHWAVSDWLAGALERRGEAVGKVCGFDIWGRCTTGQSVYMDEVIAACFVEYMTEATGYVDRGGLHVGAEYQMERGTMTARIVHRNPCASVTGDEKRLFRYVGLMIDNEGRSYGTKLFNDFGECAEGGALVV